jgi:hypothetical protein
MTVCIAVLPTGSDKIILVSDQLLSSDETSVDGVMKWATIAPDVEWYAMFAGEAPRFAPLMDRVRAILGDIRGSRLTVDTVEGAFGQAFVAEITARVEAEVLRPYGLTHADFIRKGKRLLGQVRFTYSVPYFPAFGADLADTVYRTCAAKFAAEAAPSVGKQTHVMIVAPMAGTWTLLMDVDRLRELWKSKGQPPLPAGALQLIRRDLRRLTPPPPRPRRGKT